MRDETRDTLRQIWSTFSQAEAQQVLKQFQTTIKEVIDENFRIGPTQASGSQGNDLHSTIESQPSADQQGEPTHAVRAA
jgi:hypothetical protein